MAKIIHLTPPQPAVTQALDKFFEFPFWQHALALQFNRTEISDSDYFLDWLWQHGYKVVPKDAS